MQRTGELTPDLQNPSDPDKAPLYCHWDTHCEDFPLASQTELDLHLKSHLSEHLVPIENSYGEGIACHWDSCHETFVTVDSMMAHWQNYHFQDSFHPHYAESGCPEYDLGQEHSLLSTHDDNSAVLTHSDTCGHIHKHQGNGHGYVRVHDHGEVITSVPNLSNLPDLTHSPRTSSVSSPLTHGENIQCKWVVSGVPCNHVFGSTAELKEHIESTHVASRLSEYYCGWEGCERCERPFPQRQKLIRHLQVHTKHREYKCYICDRLFAEECVLKQHLRTHSGEKPFKCEVCDKRFSSHSSLTVHKRVHTGEKPLVCKVPWCGKRFSESSNLAKHMKTHVEPAFQCEVCGRKFARRDQMVRHKRVHRVLDQAPASKVEIALGGDATGHQYVS